MTQEELQNSIEVGDEIVTDRGEKLRCVCKDNGEPIFEEVKMLMSVDDEIVFDKSMRKQIDELLQMVKDAPASRERSIAITKLQEAVMWLGMDLKRLGTPNPYPSSKDPETGSKIEPTADGLMM